MEKKFIRMNTGKGYLSLGNLYKILKENSAYENSFSQVDFFSALFNTNEISSSAVNNYLIGLRAISMEYKKYYSILKEHYQNDKSVFENIILNVVSLLENEVIMTNNKVDYINNSKYLQKACLAIDNLLNEDANAKEELDIAKLLDSGDYYNYFCNIIMYVILKNKQPLYNQTLEIDIDNEELKDYLKINLYEGMNYSNSLSDLAKKGNMYAAAEIASLYYSGAINGKKDYEKSYEYYLMAASKGHPKALWMVANMLVNKDIIRDNSIDIIHDYLNRAIEKGSIAALNTMGRCYLLGITKEGTKDEQKALEYFEKAAGYGYKYAYNNLGLYYEKIDIKKALEYYKLSAEQKDSWALNKLGEYSRKNGNIKDAYFYYNEAIDVPISEINYYAYYNLAKYYYLTKDLYNIGKAKEYLKCASEGGIKEAKMLLEEIDKKQDVI